MALDPGTITGSNLKHKHASKQIAPVAFGHILLLTDTLCGVSQNASLRLCQKHPTFVKLHLPTITQTHILEHS